MKTRDAWAGALLASAGVLGAACGGSGSSSGAPCAAGSTRACECPNGETGVQACVDDGPLWGECDCSNGGAAGATSSTASTPVRYEDADPETVEDAWSNGQDIRIDGLYGNIDVVEGSSTTTVSVDVLRFHYWLADEEEEARQMMNEYLGYGIDNVAEELFVYTERPPGVSTGIGADIVVRLPTAFDGSLTVRNRSDGPINPGDIDVQYTADAVAVYVETDTLGDCRVRGTPAVTQTVANCDGVVDVRGIADAIDINATGLQTSVSVDVQIAAISAGFAAGGTIDAESGDVNLAVPANADFVVQARTLQGSIDTGTPRSECTVQGVDPRSQTVACGATEPIYAVEACTDGVGECNVTISYE